MISKIINGDAIEEMRKLPQGSVDLILTDLPYGTTQNKWDFVIPVADMWAAMWHALKSDGVIALTASQPFTSKLIVSQMQNFKHEWIWEKDGGSNFCHAGKTEPMKEHESILIFAKKKSVFNGIRQERIGSRKGKITKSTYMSNSENYATRPDQFKGIQNAIVPELRTPRSIQRFKRERGLHPTQKPTALMEYFIKTYSNECDMVLDCTAGSGTTGVAAKNLKRDFILIEKDIKYYNICKERIED